MSENDWTCYRRNYFQVSGAFSYAAKGLVPSPLDGQLGSFDGECFIEIHGRMYRINDFKMIVTAHVAATEKIIDLVQHTSKRDKGPQMTPKPKSVKAGGQLLHNHINQMVNAQASNYSSHTIVTFERLQFKSATANNGKRRAAQQYYVLTVELYGEIEDIDGSHKLFKLASSSSAPLVVRGRSPGHYYDGERMTSPYGMLSGSAIHDGSYMSPQSAGITSQLGNSLFQTPLDNAVSNKLLMPMNPYMAGINNLIFSPTTAQFKPQISAPDMFNPNSGTSQQMNSARSERSAGAFIPSATYSDRSPLYHDATAAYNTADVSVPQQEHFLTETLGGDLFNQYEL